MKLAAKIAYNTIVQIISKGISITLGLFAVAIITRYLGQFGYGQYTTIITFLTFFGIIADFGLTLVTTQLISKPGADEKRILGNLMGLRLVSAVLFLGIAPIAVIFFPYGSDIKQGVLITSFSFLFIALNQILVGLFQKYLRMDKASIAEVVSRLILVAAVIFAWRANYGLTGILLATVLSSAVNFLIHYFLSFSLIRFQLYFDLAYWQEILKTAWPIAVTTMLNLVYLKTDILFLSLIPRSSEIGIMAEVGLYGAAYKVVDVLITIPFMFAGITLPIMTARWANSDKKPFKDILQKSFNAMVILAVPIVVGTQLVATRVMTLVAGEGFSSSGPILKILILASAIIYLSVIFSHAVIAIDKQKKIIKAYLFTAITAVIGYFFLIPRFSYFGAAWVTIYSEAIIALAAIFVVWKYANFRPDLKIFAKALLAGAIMYLTVKYFSLVYFASLGPTLIIAVFVYFTAIYAFKGITKEDVLNILNR